MENAYKQQKTYWMMVSLFALVGLFFSYRPTLHFGSVGGANLEVSVTQIGIGLFILGSIGAIIKQRRIIGKSIPVWVLTGLALVSSVSLLWTTNVSRGLLVSALLWAIVALWAALQAQAPRLVRYRPALQAAGWWAVIFVGIWSWFQVFADAIGIASAITLLPQPYVSGVFGFARPTGFALEPQFLGSLLLAPILYGLWREVRGTATAASRVLWALSLSVLIATLSRGAYLALVVGVAVVVVTNWRGNGRHVARALVMAVGVCVVSAGLLVGAAQINTRDNKNGINAVIQAANHLSIGALEIPFVPDDAAEEVTHSGGSSESKTTGIRESGYVEESTTSRLSMTQEALALWGASPRTMAIGVGAGGFGASLHERNSNHSLSSIVNNQYVETLVELGVVGAILFVGLLCLVVRWCFVHRQWLILALVAGYLVQWNFFSGNVNVLHVWVCIGAALLVAPQMIKGGAYGTAVK